MARSVASSIWQECFQADPLNPDAGRRYRDAIQCRRVIRDIDFLHRSIDFMFDFNDPILISMPSYPTTSQPPRAECLAHGGGKPSHQLVSDFLQREVVPEDLADAVVAEIDTKTEVLKAMTGT